MDDAVVAPPAGAWIEIPRRPGCNRAAPSLPPRERGLKCGLRALVACLRLSLPPRERGLKYRPARAESSPNASLPPRERGLKYDGRLHGDQPVRSLPPRERGLKCCQACARSVISAVAPPAG